MSSITAHVKSTLVTSLTLRVLTASRNHCMPFSTFQSTLLRARYSVDDDAPIVSIRLRTMNSHTDWLLRGLPLGLGRYGKNRYDTYCDMHKAIHNTY